MPVVLLIHGLGMNNYFWVDPEKCFVLGGLAPLTIFLTDAVEKSKNTISFGAVDQDIQGLWNCLKAEGFSLVSWTQSQPLGPIQVALDELEIALAKTRKKWPGIPVYLVGHSRGGLIARRFLLENSASEIEGLITICSPHAGTDMAKFSRYLKPAGVLLGKLIPAKSQALLAKALSRVATFLQSPAIEELRSDSEFITALQKPMPGKLRQLSFGGTSPALFQLAVRLPADKFKTIRFPDMLVDAISSDHLPKELRPGLGDALVTAKSARLPGSKHYDFPDNHVRAAYDKRIHEIILDFLR